MIADARLGVSADLGVPLIVSDEAIGSFLVTDAVFDPLSPTKLETLLSDADARMSEHKQADRASASAQSARRLHALHAPFRTARKAW